MSIKFAARRRFCKLILLIYLTRANVLFLLFLTLRIPLITSLSVTEKENKQFYFQEALLQSLGPERTNDLYLDPFKIWSTILYFFFDSQLNFIYLNVFIFLEIEKLLWKYIKVYNILGKIYRYA